MMLENGADRLCGCRVAINLHFVKKKKKNPQVSVKYDKAKHNKAKYTCTVFPSKNTTKDSHLKRSCRIFNKRNVDEAASELKQLNLCHMSPPYFLKEKLCECV